MYLLILNALEGWDGGLVEELASQEVDTQLAEEFFAEAFFSSKNARARVLGTSLVNLDRLGDK